MHPFLAKGRSKSNSRSVSYILFLTGALSMSSSKHSAQKSCSMNKIFNLILWCHINSYTIWDYTDVTEWLRMTLSRGMYSSNALESGGVIYLQLFLEAQIFSRPFCLQTLAVSEVINGGCNLQILWLVTNILSSPGDWSQMYWVARKTSYIHVVHWIALGSGYK